MDTTPKTNLTDIAEAAALLCTTPRHIRQLLDTGVLTRVKIGGKVRLRLDDLERLANATEVEHVPHV